MSILLTGESFNPIINDQIEARHKVYGNINKTSQDISYLYSNTSWVRLVSSVNIEKDKLKNNIAFNALELNEDIKTSNNLAKYYVLFGGTRSDSPIFTKFWGEQINNSPYPRTYGIGGSKNLGGIRPMPGITSANIKVEPGGSVKTVTVNIKANNIFQFNIIDLLYMKVGYHMLIEWGHSKILKNDRNYEDNIYNLEQDFLNWSESYSELLKKIQEYRLKSDGNYDAVLGIVVNFNWTFNNDGTYNITLTLKSIGEIIESIKLNLNAPSSDTSIPIINQLDIEIDKLKNNKPKQSFQKNSKISCILSGSIAQSFRLNIDSKDEDYIRFGYFLDNIIQPELNKILKSTNLDIKISNDDKDYYMYVPSFLISIDYKTCLVRLNHKIDMKEYTNLNPEIDIDIINYDELPKFDNLYYDDKGLKYYYGSIKDIYFNIAHIKSIITNLSNSNTNLNADKSNTSNNKTSFSFLELIKTMCNNCNNSLGNSTTLYPIFEPDTNILSINSSTQIPFRNKFLNKINGKNSILSSSSKFLVYQTGSFINNFDFNSTISSDLGMMIFMGAVQSQNNLSLPPEASGLKKLNEGLKDRIMEKSSMSSTTSNSIPTTPSIPPLDNYKKYIKAFKNPLIKLTTNNNQRNQRPENNSFDLTSIINYAEKIKNDNSLSVSGVGFLPFNANITLLGLSGIKAYQRFSIESIFLPTNYDSVDFIINTIEHKIEDNKWTTTISALTIPKPNNG